MIASCTIEITLASVASHTVVRPLCCLIVYSILHPSLLRQYLLPYDTYKTQVQVNTTAFYGTGACNRGVLPISKHRVTCPVPEIFPSSSSPGSDADRQTHDPLVGIYDAVFRPDEPPAPAGAQVQLADAPTPETGPDATIAFTNAVVSERTTFVKSVSGNGAGESPPESPAVMTDGSASAHEEGSKHCGGGGGGVTELEGGVGAGAVKSFLPEERLTLEEAVWIYTAGGAAAAGEEKAMGVIRPGFLADLTVLEVDGGAKKLLDDPRCAGPLWYAGRKGAGGGVAGGIA